LKVSEEAEDPFGLGGRHSRQGQARSGMVEVAEDSQGFSTAATGTGQRWCRADGAAVWANEASEFVFYCGPRFVLAQTPAEDMQDRSKGRDKVLREETACRGIPFVQVHVQHPDDNST
jgi:hypothetical protein